jgi:hypothetical protein
VDSAAPDFIEPVLGWRVWLVVEDLGVLRLASVLYPTVWQPRHEMTARCELAPHARGFHRPPHGECSCGLYAAAALTDAVSYFDGYGQRSRSPVYRVLGRVALWGRVIEGDRGWRSSYGYPARIYVPEVCLGGDGSRAADEIALALADYGVPIEIVDGRTKGRIAKLVLDEPRLAA